MIFLLGNEMGVKMPLEWLPTIKGVLHTQILFLKSIKLKNNNPNSPKLDQQSFRIEILDPNPLLTNQTPTNVLGKNL